MKRTVGFIGLGVMGQAMARNLSKKYPGLLVYDTDRVKMDSLPKDTTVAAEDIPDIARRCDLVFLSLPTSAVVREVICGGEGIIRYMKKGGVVADTSTTEVSAVKAIAAELEKQGLHFADTPVSGGEKAAVEGTLSFMAGAGEPVFAAIKDYCGAMGSPVVHMGPVGTGQIAKAVNQMIVGAAFAVIAESFSLGVKNGLNAETLYEAIKGGWAGSKVLDVAAKDMFSREFKPGGTVDIHWKDLGYALGLSKDTDVPVPVTALVHEIFKAARARGEGKRSQPAVVRLWESLLNIEIA
ncbi:MAG: NAD-binding protein [Treponema sp.]|jgi:2-hydroxy-3-oxopropionate reductase|nr:NAD-binding protein [Treponema sp.]